MVNTNPNHNSCTIPTLLDMSKQYDLVGDVLEFGTCTCQSAIELATLFPNKIIFTVDHFQGLEKSKKTLPHTSDWREGSFALGSWNAQHKVFPKTIEEAKQKLSIKHNIKLVLSDIHKLTEPQDYDINEIAICNVDVDIYEPTVSSLEFLTKCKWSQVFIRFDDWHGGENEYDEHERLAFTEWIEKYNYQYEVIHGGVYGGIIIKR